MKKLTAALLALICVFTLAACGKTAEKKEFTPGKIEGNVYTSKFAGIKLEAPDGWKFASDEDIKGALGTAADSAADIIGEQNMDAAIENTVTDAVLYDSATGSSAAVVFENMEGTFGDADHSPEEYAGILESNMKKTGEGFVFDEHETVQFCGNEYLRASTSLNNQGNEIRQTFFLRKIDGYMLSVCVSDIFTSSEDYDAMLSMFSALDD